jgi:hypothetical protein
VGRYPRDLATLSVLNEISEADKHFVWACRNVAVDITVSKVLHCTARNADGLGRGGGGGGRRQTRDAVVAAA